MDKSNKVDSLHHENLDFSTKKQKEDMQPMSEEESDGIKDINKVAGQVPSQPPTSIFISDNILKNQIEEGEIFPNSENFSENLQSHSEEEDDESEIIKNFDFDINSLDQNFTPRDLVKVFVHLSLNKQYDHGLNNVTKTELSMKGIKFWDNLSANPKFRFLFVRYKPWSLHTSFKRLFSRASVGQIIKLLNEDPEADINSLTNLFKKSKKRKIRKNLNKNNEYNFLKRKRHFEKNESFENINQEGGYSNTSNPYENDFVVDLSSCKIDESYNKKNLNFENLKNHLPKRINCRNIYRKRTFDKKESDSDNDDKVYYLPVEKINLDVNKDYSKNKFENFFNFKAQRNFLDFVDKSLLSNLQKRLTILKDDLSDLYDEHNNKLDNNKIKGKVKSF
jgi:hypothetical protein